MTGEKETGIPTLLMVKCISGKCPFKSRHTFVEALWRKDSAFHRTVQGALPCHRQTAQNRAQAYLQRAQRQFRNRNMLI